MMTRWVGGVMMTFGVAAAFAGCKSISEEPIGSTGQRAIVTRAGDGFAYKGGPFKFIGVNLRGTAYHSDGDINAQLQSAWSMGARVVRIFIANNKLSPGEVAAKLGNFLDRASAISLDLKVMVSLTDWYGAQIYIGDYAGAKLGVQGDDMYYTRPCDQSLCLNSAWFTGGYQGNYKTFVQTLVTSFKSDDRIFAWELGNELSTGGGATDMLNFAYTMGWNIRAWGAQQMVTTGFIDVNHAINGNVNNTVISQMYTGPWAPWNSSPFDFGSIHAYNNEQVAGSGSAQDWDIGWYLTHGYPYVVGEGGFTGGNASGCPEANFTGGTWEGVSIPNASSDRGPAVAATIDHFFDVKSADGYMQWGFEVGGTKIGEGGNCREMETISHTDWDSLFSVYSKKAATLPSGGVSGASSGPGGTAGCDNGVPIGGTACKTQGDTVEYVCLPGSTPGNSQWSSQSCNGGTCQGSACTGGGPAGCDNGVPVGGTACKTQGDTVEYLCLPGSTPGNSKWSPQSCNGGTCQGSACTGGGSSSSSGGSSSSSSSSGGGPACPSTGKCGCKKGVDNFCLYGVNVPGCTMTAPGGYCDKNGDGSFSDADWNKGYYEYQAACTGMCTGPSCGQLKTINGWASAKCEWNGNGACGGWGTPTYDCDFCCP